MNYRLELRRAPDRHGNQEFVLFWEEKNGKEYGQWFHSNPDTKRQELEKIGHTVTVEKRY